jgi:predicted nucleic acid-binding protein
MSESVPRVYLDVCALCRPFDDQAQMRVRLETEAVQLVLSHVRLGDLTLMVSPVHSAEISAISDPVEREHLVLLLREIGTRVDVDVPRARQRAEQLVQQGLGLADAAHLAYAEEAKASFVTCDDQLIRQCHRVQPGIWYGTPVALCDEQNL